MDVPAELHPAGEGLWDSGYVVSVVRKSDDIDMAILGDGHFVGITLAGNPCRILVGCSATGARALIAKLTAGLDQLTPSGAEVHHATPS